jgi:alcohol dehydrogenase (cytochrome c)
MAPKRERQDINRGAALWGNLVIVPVNWPPRIVAADKDTVNVVCETNMTDGQPGVRITAAPLAIKEGIIVGASGGDRGVREWIAGLDAATGRLLWRKYTVPAPGEPGSETWKDKNNAWQTGGGAVWVTGTYDPETDETIWGTGNPAPMFDPNYPPGDNVFTNSAISWNP